MMYWLLLPQKKKLQTSNAGGWIIRSGKGQGLGENGRTSAAPPAATSRCTFSRHHRPKDLSILQRDIYLIKFKYCKDTRAQNQLSTRQEQQKDLCTTLTLRSMYYIILLGMGIAIYNTYTMEPFSKNKKDCFQASCAFCQPRCYNGSLIIPQVPFSVLLLTGLAVQDQGSDQACNPPGSQWFQFFLCGERNL